MKASYAFVYGRYAYIYGERGGRRPYRAHERNERVPPRPRRPLLVAVHA